MINLTIRIVICCCFFLLASCLHRPVPANTASCIASCESRLAACTKVCRNNCGQCSAAAGQTAARNYGYYEHEKMEQGKIIALQLNSFRDPLQCRKVTCNCQADYAICRQSCGGAITKRLEHAPLCS
ncbi:hypothetical protein BN59_03461 [Legionella massiliensis]|uniref:Acyltransferase n=1 Tax=Legionella massiliensis TaxID=1034943 RepID=A0A078L5D7_9GAMM|nr:hypothetical protein [Legionella massiliensis]CDZ79143.1 hypothetical protein BN59_03461 [Legionella massiliensis]CEE14881.1 hypothetical protein BN1094_03461 [Legionella massiliensis]